MKDEKVEIDFNFADDLLKLDAKAINSNVNLVSELSLMPMKSAKFINLHVSKGNENLVNLIMKVFISVVPGKTVSSLKERNLGKVCHKISFNPNGYGGVDLPHFFQTAISP